MSKIIYKDENITIKEISDRKIQVEKIVPVYVGEYLAEHIKMKTKFVGQYKPLWDNPGESVMIYERMDLKTPEKVSLSVKYGSKLGIISYVNLPMHSPIENISLVRDVSHIQINDKHLERALKLKIVLE